MRHLMVHRAKRQRARLLIAQWCREEGSDFASGTAHLRRQVTWSGFLRRWVASRVSGTTVKEQQ